MVMQNRGHALSRDELIRVLTAYTGVTTADGVAGGTTLIDSNLINNPLISPSGIAEKTILIATGNARGEDKASILFNNANGTITLQGAGFSAQILRGTLFRIVNFSSLDILGGATGIFHEQADAGFSENITAAETFIVTLNAADTRYILRDLRIKSADPTVANTITVKLYTLINSLEVNVDSFIITNANFGIYFTLVDMFGVPYVAGDSIRVSLQGSAAGPYVVAGQFSHAKTNV